MREIYKLHKNNDKFAFLAGIIPGAGQVMGPYASQSNLYYDNMITRDWESEGYK